METVRTFLVIGSAGFGGRALVAALHGGRHRVVQYDMASRSADDIRDAERVLGIPNREEIDTVFHLTAQPIIPALPAGNPYSASKQTADPAVQSWAPEFGLKVGISRFVNTYR